MISQAAGGCSSNPSPRTAMALATPTTGLCQGGALLVLAHAIDAREGSQQRVQGQPQILCDRANDDSECTGEGPGHLRVDQQQQQDGTSRIGNRVQIAFQGIEWCPRCRARHCLRDEDRETDDGDHAHEHHQREEVETLDTLVAKAPAVVHHEAP